MLHNDLNHALLGLPFRRGQLVRNFLKCLKAPLGRSFLFVVVVVLLPYRSVNHTLGKLAGMEFDGLRRGQL